jgi:hypothetical protein
VRTLADAWTRGIPLSEIARQKVWLPARHDTVWSPGHSCGPAWDLHPLPRSSLSIRRQMSGYTGVLIDSKNHRSAVPVPRKH